MICAKCGEENLENAIFCAYCGKSLSQLCPSCGDPLTLSDDMCPKCGGYADDTNISSKKKFEVTYSPQRKRIFIFAIVGTVLTQVFGFIFSIIAWKMGNDEVKKHPKDWMVRVGRMMAKISTFISIAVSLYFAVMIIIAIIAGVTNGSSGNGIVDNPYLLR